jgi:hypothetical protein
VINVFIHFCSKHKYRKSGILGAALNRILCICEEYYSIINVDLKSISLTAELVS